MPIQPDAHKFDEEAAYVLSKVAVNIDAALDEFDAELEKIAGFADVANRMRKGVTNFAGNMMGSAPNMSLPRSVAPPMGQTIVPAMERTMAPAGRNIPFGNQPPMVPVQRTPPMGAPQAVPPPAAASTPPVASPPQAIKANPAAAPPPTPPPGAAAAMAPPPTPPPAGGLNPGLSPMPTALPQFRTPVGMEGLPRQGSVAARAGPVQKNPVLGGGGTPAPAAAAPPPAPTPLPPAPGPLPVPPGLAAKAPAPAPVPAPQAAPPPPAQAAGTTPDYFGQAMQGAENVVNNGMPPAWFQGLTPQQRQALMYGAAGLGGATLGAGGAIAGNAVVN